jgi:BASS family bile acid:Na+ symporter
VVDLKSILDVGVPVLAFTTLLAIGLDLTPEDFSRLRRSPLVVAAGLIAPLVLLPLLAVALIRWFAPDPAVEAGLLLVAACPIGGISNTYTYLARASTALSVTLTGLSCTLAVFTIPLLTRLFQHFLRDPLHVDAPVAVLTLQVFVMLALPLGIGMRIRRRWPAWARDHRPFFQRLSFVLLGMILLLVLTVEARRAVTMFRDVVPLAAAFVTASFAAGWITGSAVKAAAADRFTLASEFATRNVSIAVVIAVTLLGRVEFAVFASVYFLTELPLMLAAVAAWRWRLR